MKKNKKKERREQKKKKKLTVWSVYESFRSTIPLFPEMWRSTMALKLAGIRENLV